jgi:anti-sigma-K factor RskA
MNNQFLDIEWIDRYIVGMLSKSERKWIEQRLASEPDLRILYKERQFLIDGIRYANLQQKLIELRELEKELRETERNIRALLMDIPFDITSTIGRATRRLLINSEAYSHKQGDVKLWKPLAIAAVALIAFTLCFTTMKKTPRSSIDCLASISSFNKC